MTKIRNVSGVELYVSWLDKVVGVDEVVDVPDEDGAAYLAQEQTWVTVDAPVDAPTDAPTTTEGDL